MNIVLTFIVCLGCQIIEVVRIRLCRLYADHIATRCFLNYASHILDAAVEFSVHNDPACRGHGINTVRKRLGKIGDENLMICSRNNPLNVRVVSIVVRPVF